MRDGCINHKDIIAQRFLCLSGGTQFELSLLLYHSIIKLFFSWNWTSETGNLGASLKEEKACPRVSVCEWGFERGVHRFTRAPLRKGTPVLAVKVSGECSGSGFSPNSSTTWEALFFQKRLFYLLYTTNYMFFFTCFWIWRWIMTLLLQSASSSLWFQNK